MNESTSQTDYVNRQYAAVDKANSTRMYLNEIAREPLLDDGDHEKELAKIIEAGVYAEKLLTDPDAKWAESYTSEELEWMVSEGVNAKQQMLRANLRLVASVARNYKGFSMDFLDLAQEGSFGLTRAVEKFDYTKGYKFSTYATAWIQKFISRSMYDHDESIRIERHRAERLSRMIRRERAFTQKYGYEPTDEQLAKEVKTTVEDILHLRSLPKVIASVDTPISEDGAIALEALVAGTPQDEVEEAAIGDEAYWMAEELLGTLSEFERNVVCMRFGWYGGEELSFVKIGQKLSIGQKKVSEVFSEAMRKMKDGISPAV